MRHYPLMGSGHHQTDIEARINQARLALLEAMMAPAEWGRAMDSVALACGGGTGQIIVQNSSGDILLHHVTHAPDDLDDRLMRSGLTDPARNPRIRIGRHALPMTLYADQDYVDADTRRRLPIYTDFFDPLGFSYNCQVVLHRDTDLMVRASVSRSSQQGVFDSDALRAMTELSPYLRTASHHYVRLGRQRLQSVCDALEATGTCAFVLDAHGRVLSATRLGGAAIDQGTSVRLFNGHYMLIEEAARNRFAAGLSEVVSHRKASDCVRYCGGVIDLSLLPDYAEGWGTSVAVLVVMRDVRNATERREMLRFTYGLTPAEAEVVLALAEGHSAKTIADQKAVALTTVRTQIQRAYAKLGIGRQAELIRLLSPQFNA